VVASSVSGDGSGTFRGETSGTGAMLDAESKPTGTSCDAWRWNGLRVWMRDTGEPGRSVSSGMSESYTEN
jgi:hypothetical protein